MKQKHHVFIFIFFLLQNQRIGGRNRSCGGERSLAQVGGGDGKERG
jgi:hypothetical protein